MSRFLSALALVACLVLSSAPVSAADSIAVAAGSDLSYQGAVTFDTNVDSRLKGYEYPMVYVACYQDGSLVYGQLDHADATFILGGGGSIWVYDNPNTPADCEATLWAYPGLHKGNPRLLAGPVFFAAAA